MKKIYCLIIEDEPLAAELLTDYINQLDHLVIQGVCHKAVDAIMQLREKKVDLIFLDLHLPGIKGFDFLKSLPSPPKIIVTTAYHQYALEGYELNVLDYLIKPIEFSRFIKAIAKLAPTEISSDQRSEKPMVLIENRLRVPVLPSAIIYIESQKDYVHLYCHNKQVKSKITLQAVENILPAGQFLRIHKSFIVSIEKVQSFNNRVVMVNEKILPIGRNFKASVQQALSAKK